MKFGRFNDVARKMADQIVAAEAYADLEEAQTTTVSVKVAVPTAAMLSLLSELFGQSRYAFTGELLEDFTADLFFNLPENKRNELAVRADKITTDILAKQGVTVTSGGPAGNISEDQTWRCLNASKALLSAYSDEAA